MAKLKMLLSLRAWWKSRTLNAAGLLGAIAGVDLTTGSGVIQWVVELLATSAGVMPATALALLVAIKSGADALLRAKTDRALDKK